jgi:2-octaprenyl-6-methoxyphenol hydroxylase
VSTNTLDIAIVGAGPVGLAFACACADALPRARLQLFDALPIDGQPRQDGRTLALSLGSIHWLRRLGAWPEGEAEPMQEVSVSQISPGRAEVRLRARELGMPMLGAVLGYPALQLGLQRAWLRRAADARLGTRAETRVAALKPLSDGGVELDAGVAERFDLVVLAEGGLFSEQASKPWHRDYAQTAWVGTVLLGQDWPRGLAVERFTRDGPLAVLPLPDEAGQRRAALVWCTAPDESAEALSLARLRALLPRGAQAVDGFAAPLKPFALGLNAEPQPLQGRVLRIGNAAQTLHPVAGQGLNLGLRDAHELVSQLRDGGDLDAALRRCARRRQPDRYALLATTDLLARVFAIDAAPLSLAREAGLRLLQAVPPLRHGLARQLMFGWR